MFFGNKLTNMNMEKCWLYSMRFFSRYWGCHQIADRSFFVGEYQFPLCARCTGILIGIIFSLSLLIYDKTLINMFDVLEIIIIIIPLLLDGFTQLLTSYESNNEKRFLTGLMFGGGVCFLVFKIIYLWVYQ